MNTFALDKNYQQFNFEEISIDELEIISGGTGVANANAGLQTSYYSNTSYNTYSWLNEVTAYAQVDWYKYTYINSSGASISGTGSGNFA